MKLACLIALFGWLGMITHIEIEKEIVQAIPAMEEYRYDLGETEVEILVKGGGTSEMVRYEVSIVEPADSAFRWTGPPDTLIYKKAAFR